jgi:hypothetical protein
MKIDIENPSDNTMSCSKTSCNLLSREILEILSVIGIRLDHMSNTSLTKGEVF